MEWATSAARGSAGSGPRESSAGAVGNAGAKGTSPAGCTAPAVPAVTLEPATRGDAGTAAELRRSVGADAVLVYAVEPDGSLRCVGHAGVPARIVSQWRWIPAGVPAPAVLAAHEERPIWLPDLGEAPDRYVLPGRESQRWAAQAWLPAYRRERVVGAIGILWERPMAVDEMGRQAAQHRCRAAGTALTCQPESPTTAVDARADAQSLLDMVPGSVVVLAPVRDGDEVVDFTVVARSPGAADIAERQGYQLVGQRVRAAYPAAVTDGLFDVYREVLRTGQPRDAGPYHLADYTSGRPATALLALRVHRYGTGLLVSWLSRDDERREAVRMMQVQVLGQLGWAEWDLVQDRIEWSDHLYAILGRDRGDGPVRFDRLEGVFEPADVARLKSVITALTTAGAGGDLRIRVHLSGERRHLRLVMQVVRDSGGRALKMSFLVQDVTAIEQAQLRVADVERQLVERQRSQEAEHRVAQELRHIILPLPAAPVCLPGLQVAVRYLPAEEASLIGGDWYDASALPSGGALLAVGDVAGHGLASAATMAELRHALKTLTITGSAEPGFLVGGLNRLLCGGEAHPGRTGTVVIAHFDPGTAMLTWAQAGHPAPLLVRDGRVVELPRPYGVLLGANPDSRYETCATRLTSSDTLLLYTDGLVERRGGDCDAGLDDVTAALLSTLDREPAVSLTELLTRLPPANPTDDMCILVARATT